MVPAVIGTGDAKVTLCQPDVSSPEKVPCASSVPLADHSAPMCVPVFAAAL